MHFYSQRLKKRMRKARLCLLALALGAWAAPALAQQCPDGFIVSPSQPGGCVQLGEGVDIFSDDAFDLPDAPDVKIPGGPAPEPLCTLAAVYDFENERYNPGLVTAAQYRRWSISDYDRKNPAHLYFLGLMIEYGHHMAKDDLRAQRLYQQAADMGFRPALERLGLIACSKKLYCTSARLFHDAGVSGSKLARMTLSRHYRWGKGVFYDLSAAYMWAWIGMQKTKGNWVVADPDGESYLRSMEIYLSETDQARAEEQIAEWKEGFVPRLYCQQD